MSLINNVPTNPTDPTKEELTNRNNARIKKIALNIYRTMQNRHESVWDMIWNNKDGLTPQEVLDSFGPDAAELFLFSSNIQTMLATAGAGYSPVDTPNEFTVNPDGTVTIGDVRVIDNPSE